jgi:hypothetical protein
LISPATAASTTNGHDGTVEEEKKEAPKKDVSSRSRSRGNRKSIFSGLLDKKTDDKKEVKKEEKAEKKEEKLEKKEEAAQKEEAKATHDSTKAKEAAEAAVVAASKSLKV